MTVLNHQQRQRAKRRQAQKTSSETAEVVANTSGGENVPSKEVVNGAAGKASPPGSSSNGARPKKKKGGQKKAVLNENSAEPKSSISNGKSELLITDGVSSKVTETSTSDAKENTNARPAAQKKKRRRRKKKAQSQPNTAQVEANPTIKDDAAGIVQKSKGDDALDEKTGMSLTPTPDIDQSEVTSLTQVVVLDRKKEVSNDEPASLEEKVVNEQVEANPPINDDAAGIVQKREVDDALDEKTDTSLTFTPSPDIDQSEVTSLTQVVVLDRKEEVSNDEPVSSEEQVVNEDVKNLPVIAFESNDKTMSPNEAEKPSIDNDISTKIPDSNNGEDSASFDIVSKLNENTIPMNSIVKCAILDEDIVAKDSETVSYEDKLEPKREIDLSGVVLESEEIVLPEIIDSTIVKMPKTPEPKLSMTFETPINEGKESTNVNETLTSQEYYQGSDTQVKEEIVSKQTETNDEVPKVGKLSTPDSIATEQTFNSEEVSSDGVEISAKIDMTNLSSKNAFVPVHDPYSSDSQQDECACIIC